MIQHIQIYSMGNNEWSMQINKQHGESVQINNISELYPKLIKELLIVANSIKTPEEETLERTFQMVEQLASDEQIFELKDVIPLWELNINYKKNMVRKYNEKFYRCLQDHISEINREPNKATSLWVEIGEDEAGGGGIISWFKPTSDHYYELGQLMRYKDGLVYESLLAVNVYSPESYPAGWKLREDLD